MSPLGPTTRSALTPSELQRLKTSSTLGTLTKDKAFEAFTARVEICTTSQKEQLANLIDYLHIAFRFLNDNTPLFGSHNAILKCS